MRIDKLLSVCLLATRSEAGKAARAGRITVNGIAERNAARQIDPCTDEITFDGVRVNYSEHVYIMLNKPMGVVSATEDGRDTTVLDLIPADRHRNGMFPCGRLDKNTLGLVILTDDGELAHRLLSPRYHVEKKYRFECRYNISEKDRSALEQGLILADGYMTKPARVELSENMHSGTITIHEGKYHQIKRMFGTVGDNRITYLERISFGPVELDSRLKRGEWRYLTERETELLKEAGNTENPR